MRVAGGCDCFGRFAACLIFVFLRYRNAVVEWMLIKKGSGSGQLRGVGNLAVPPLRRRHVHFVDIYHERRMIGADNLCG